MKKAISLICVCGLLMAALLSFSTSALAMRIYLPNKDYPTLKRGSTGDDVKRLQSELIYRGYLAEGENDGTYGQKTALAVHLFKEQNGISDNCSDSMNCVATNEMQKVLFSNKAVQYTQPSFSLSFPSGSRAEWKNLSGNKLSIRFKVTNLSTTYTVKSFRMQVYAEDRFGYKIYGNGTVYYSNMKITIKPSQQVFSDYFCIPDRDEIYKVYARITDVEYSDGSTVANSDTSYTSWTLD